MARGNTVKFRHESRHPYLLCSVAAAILGAGALGAGASIWGANKASDAQTNTANQNILFQKGVMQQNQNNLQPFINAGANGIPALNNWLDPNNASGPLNALMRLTMPGSNQSETLAQTPGFQFAEDRGLRANNNALAARGLGGSAAVVKGANDFTTGLASGTWQSVVNALQGLFGSGAGAMQNLVSSGGNAAGGLSSSLLGSAGNVGNALTGIGNAQGGAATATGNAVGQFGNSVSTAAILQKLLGNSGQNGGNAGLYALPQNGSDYAGLGGWGAPQLTG